MLHTGPGQARPLLWGMLRLRVKEIAESKGYNQSQLSRAADMPLDTIRRIWHNPYHEVRLSTLNRIAQVLQVPAKDLFEEVVDTPKQPSEDQ